MSFASFFSSCVRPIGLAAGLLTAAVGAFAQINSPSADDGFDPNVDGNVYALATQADGKVLVAGEFTTLRPNGQAFVTNRANLARLNADGTLDAAFAPSVNGPVRAVVLQADGKILIGGDFTALQPAGAATATTRNRLARLNADGSLDTAFNPNVGGGLVPQVNAIVLQADGRIVIAGSFATVQPNGAATATARNRMARLNPDGSLDATYDPNPNGIVLSMVLHLDGKVVVGGGFTSFQSNGATSATTRNRIARLNPSGTLDSEFNPNANNAVSALAVQRDGKIALGGSFTTLQPTNEINVANRTHLARLNPDGSIDSEFFPVIGGNVLAIAVQPDGGLLFGGAFTGVAVSGSGAVGRNYLARVNADGTLDGGFNPNPNQVVDAFAVQSDGKILVGGYFTRLQPNGAAAATARNRLARINPNGSLDAAFAIANGGRPLVSVTQADGKVVIGGTFTNVGGATHNYLARLNADGSVDAAYKPDLDARVLAMVLQPDGKVIVGGAFTTITGETRNHLARLNPSGTIDSEFNPNINGPVSALALQSDGKILVGGSFGTVQPIGVALALSRNNLIRLNANGSLDTAFDPEPNGPVVALVVQSDGKIVAGGTFTTVQPGGAPTVTTATDGTVTTTASKATITARNRLVRFNADGALDTPFDSNFNAEVSALALQSDGKIIAGGLFTALNPVGAPSVTTQNADGTSTTTTVITRARLVRLNADGSVDGTFDPNPNGTVLTAAVQADQKILIGGAFTALQALKPTAAANVTLRKYAARLNPDGTVDTTFDLDLSEQLGNRVDSIRLAPDGKLLVAGNFVSLQPTGTAARGLRNHFARINTNGTLDTGFDPAAGGAAGGQIKALAVQADGKVVAVGAFTDLGGALTTNIARFATEGAPDLTFSTALSADGPLNAVVVRPNGSAVPAPLNGFAWFNRDGTIRTAFNPSVRLTGRIDAIAVQADGRVLLGGIFTNISGTTAGNLVRFNADGTLDPTFNPRPNAGVSSIVIQPDGRILIAGLFTLVGDTTRNRLARLGADGALDTTFDPNASAKVSAMNLQADGKLVIGGAFTTLTPNGATTAVTRNYLARLNADGSLDADYNPNPSSTINAIALQADGKMIVGGAFTTLTPNSATAATTRNFIARLNTDGTLDTNFDPNANAQIYALAAQPDGKILLGGAFTTLQPNGAASAITRNNLARVNGDGTVDLAFIPDPNGAVTALSLQTDGTVLIAGTFSTLKPNGASIATARKFVARLTGAGILDPLFNPGVDNAVTTFAADAAGNILVGGAFVNLEPNGAFIVGGSFATIGGVTTRNVALVNDDGSVNSSFLPSPNGAVNALLALPDGRTVMGGAFTAVSAATRNRLARFNADGAFDATFNPNAGGDVAALALQPDGKILAGGSFTTMGGAARTFLARLNADGTLDPAFAPAFFTAASFTGVTALAVQADGRVLAVGFDSRRNVTALVRLSATGETDASFSSAITTGVIASLALQTDGKILVGGTFAGAVANLARLNANGSLDPAFNPAPNAAVTALAPQSDGRLLIGGNFSNVGGLARVSLARLAPTGPAAQTVAATTDRRSLLLTRTGSAGELSGVTFERSADGRTWLQLGQGSRVAGTANWQLGGLTLPATGSFYVRVRALAPTAGTSSSLYETVREINFASPASAPLSDPANVASSSTFPVDWFDGVISPLAAGTAGSGSGTAGNGDSSGQTGGTTAAASTSRLADLATRGQIVAGSPLITGFTVGGTAPRTVLVRAVGPSLGMFGVQGALAAPKLQLFNGAGALVLENSGWTSAPGVAAAIAQTGAFPFAANGGADAAAVATLAPGSYSMQVVDRTGTGGIALAEVYDAGDAASARLTNLSSRGTVGTGANAFIGGLVISGNAPKRLLVRGVGPALAKFGVTGALADPLVGVYDSSGRLLASNDNWSALGATAELADASAQVGAFVLDAGSKDAALIVLLAPGAYSVQVSGVGGGTGTALLEVYELP